LKALVALAIVAGGLAILATLIVAFSGYMNEALSGIPTAPVLIVTPFVLVAAGVAGCVAARRGTWYAVWLFGAAAGLAYFAGPFWSAEGPYWVAAPPFAVAALCASAPALAGGRAARG